jgi:hypothetical protein
MLDSVFLDHLRMFIAQPTKEAFRRRTPVAESALVGIKLEDLTDTSLVMPMSAVFRTDRPPGPAGRWLIERLKSNISPRARPAKARRRPSGTAAGVARNQAAPVAKPRASVRNS